LAFFRFNRDKRGYEHFFLVEPVTSRRGNVRARVLYWFRTPPNVKIGREPFDPEVRRALEAQNPGSTFDWRRIAETPIPSADAERWRERRLAERAARKPTRAEAAAPSEGVAAPVEAPSEGMPSEEAEADRGDVLARDAQRDREAALDHEVTLVREVETERETSLDHATLKGETLEGDEIVAAAVDAAERQEDELVPEGSLNPVERREPLVEIAVTKPLGAAAEPAMPGHRRRRRRRRGRRGRGRMRDVPPVIPETVGEAARSGDPLRSRDDTESRAPNPSRKPDALDPET
jgi:hypothetical protein